MDNTPDCPKFKKVFRIGFTPKYSEEFDIGLDAKLFLYLSTKVFEKLEWEVVYISDTSVEAKRFKRERESEKITVTYTGKGRIVVESKFLDDRFLDFGTNSKVVQLFIYIFHQYLNSLDSEQLKEARQEMVRIETYEDYVVPESLPTPPRYKKSNFPLFIAAFVLLAVLAGYLVSLLTINLVYMLILFEVGIAWMFSNASKYIISYTNYTDYDKIKYVLGGAVFLTFLSNEFFIYLNLDWLDGNFIDYLVNRFEQGLILKNHDFSSLGLVVFWLFQLIFTFLIARIFIVQRVGNYIVDLIPPEVLEFTIYLSARNKSDEEIIQALSEKGWGDPQNYELIFEALGIIYSYKMALRK